MSDTTLQQRLEEATLRVIRCGLCSDVTATGYCLACDMFVCNNCTSLLHEDITNDKSHRIHILVKGRPSFGDKNHVDRRITPTTSYADKVAGVTPTPTSNQKGAPTTLEQKSSSQQPPPTYRPLSITSTFQPTQQVPTPSPSRPITRLHELSRFRLFTCLSSSSCQLFPAIMTYNSFNDAKTTNILLDHILTTCSDDVDEAISICQRLHAGGYSFENSEQLIDAIAYIHDENVAQRMHANPQLTVPKHKVVLPALTQTQTPIQTPIQTLTPTPTPTLTPPPTPIIPKHPHQQPPRYIVPATVPTLHERVAKGTVLMEMSTPNNGDCALYAIALAALMPHLYNPTTFDMIATKLVDITMCPPTTFANLRTCFTSYLQQGGMSSILASSMAVTEFLYFMRLKMCQQLRANGDALLVGLEQPDIYVEKMHNPGEWLDHRELSALSLLLSAPIHITALDRPVLIIHTHLHVIDVEKGTHNALVVHYTAGDEESGHSASMSYHNHYTAMVIDPRIARDMEKLRQEEIQRQSAAIKRQAEFELKQKEKLLKEEEERKKAKKEEEDDGNDRECNNINPLNGLSWLRSGFKKEQKRAEKKARQDAEIAQLLAQQRAQAAALKNKQPDVEMMDEHKSIPITSIQQANTITTFSITSTPIFTPNPATVPTSTPTPTPAPAPAPSAPVEPQPVIVPTETKAMDIDMIPEPGAPSSQHMTPTIIPTTSTSPQFTATEWEHIDANPASPTIAPMNLLSHVIVDDYTAPTTTTTTTTTTASIAPITKTEPDDDLEDWDVVG